MRSRLVAALSAIALFVSGCGAGSTSVTPGATLGPFDRATVTRLMAQGLNEPEALILAMTKIAVVSEDEQSVHFTGSFPTGGTIDIKVTVSPAATAAPSPPEVTSAATADGHTFTVRYGVRSRAGLTGQERTARVNTAVTGTQLAFANTSQGGPVVADGAKGDLDVFVQGTVSETSKAVFDEFVEKMQTYLKAEGTLDQFVEGLKAVGSIFDALDLRADYQKLVKRIDALERCAKNPTNDLTIKLYQQDPTERTRLLDLVAATRVEIKANTAAQFLGVMDSLASDLTGSKLLGIVTGVGTSMTKNTLDGLNEQVLGDLERSIVKCEKETPAPSADESAATTPDATTPPDTSTSPPATTQPGAPPTIVQGTITWNTTDATFATSGSVTFNGKAFMDIGDYQVQSGSTYVYDYSQVGCGGTHKSGVLERWAPAVNRKPGVGQVNMVGGAGAPLAMFLLLDGDTYACTERDGPNGGYNAAPLCARVIGAFKGDVYTFSCELRSGVTGSLSGTLATRP